MTKSRLVLVLAAAAVLAFVVPQASRAQVACETVMECQFDAPPPLGGLEPAVAFSLGADDTVHIEWLVSAGLDCAAPPDLVAGDLALTAGDWVVYISFDPPPPVGTELSGQWTIGTCDQRACANYVMGSEPALCGAGATRSVQLDPSNNVASRELLKGRKATFTAKKRGEEVGITFAANHAE